MEAADGSNGFEWPFSFEKAIIHQFLAKDSSAPEPMSKAVILGVSAFLSLVATVFYCTGIAASTTYFHTLQNVNWAHSVNSDFGDVYIGFKAIGFRDKSTDTNYIFKLDHCNDEHNSTSTDDLFGNNDFCENCADDGKADLGLIAVALSFAVISLIVGLVRFGMDSDPVKYTHILTNVISITFGIAAWGNYSNCYHALEDAIPITFDYGPGWILTLTATFLQVFGTILIFAVGGGAAESDATQVPTTEMR